MDHSDQKKIQEKITKYSAVVSQGKLLLEINDNITYKGVVESSPYYDINELKTIFEKGQITITVKTTSKLVFKLGFLKIQMQSQESLQLQELKKRVEQLEINLKIAEQKNPGQWEQENLDSKANFDMDYIYKVNTANGWSVTTIGVSSGALNFNCGGNIYSISSSNRRANSGGWTITKMMRYKV